MSNNDILKKLRVALSLRNDDIIEILPLVDLKFREKINKIISFILSV